MKLIDHFQDLHSHEWDNCVVAKYYDVEVVQEFHSVPNNFGKPVKPWPGPSKNVYCWVVLANGKAVGWNENPSKGWSFPVVTFK